MKKPESSAKSSSVIDDDYSFSNLDNYRDSRGSQIQNRQN